MKLIYFASVRERLGVAEEELTLPSQVHTLDELVDWLAKERGEPWAQVLREPRLLCALNQEMASLNSIVTDADEVAFFPPVTGG